MAPKIHTKLSEFTFSKIFEFSRQKPRKIIHSFFRFFLIFAHCDKQEIEK